MSRSEKDGAKQPAGPASLVAASPVRVAGVVLVLAMAFFALWWGFSQVQSSDLSETTLGKVTMGSIAVFIGVVGVWGMFIAADYLVSLLPSDPRNLLRPFVYVGPALLILGVYLVYPAFYTVVISFLGDRSQEFVGFENYVFAFTNPAMQVALRNNLLWMVFVTGGTVSLGLVIAVLVDRLGTWEPVAKAIIFLPMAISTAGASVIWRFMYYPAPEREEQIGLLNAIIVGLGGEPVGFTIEQPLNNFALMIIMVWIWTGFCMVILSAAIKDVPDDLVESARIDGASEVRIFFRVLIPYIRGTIITVATTVLILVLKVFDIVYVMTNGQFDTEVVANRMYNEMFKFGDYGHASALVVLLFVATIPVMIFNIRNLRAEKR
jgi:alpha-glucoside transport system permease protein